MFGLCCIDPSEVVGGAVLFSSSGGGGVCGVVVLLFGIVCVRRVRSTRRKSWWCSRVSQVYVNYMSLSNIL